MTDQYINRIHVLEFELMQTHSRIAELEAQIKLHIALADGRSKLINELNQQLYQQMRLNTSANTPILEPDDEHS